VIGGGATTEAIFKEIPDATGTLPKLLWFLEVGGVLERDPSVAEQVEAIRETLRGSCEQFKWGSSLDVGLPSSATATVVETQDMALDEDESKAQMDEPSVEEEILVSAEEEEPEAVVVAAQDESVEVIDVADEKAGDEPEDQPGVAVSGDESVVVVEVAEEETEPAEVSEAEGPSTEDGPKDASGTAEVARAYIEQGDFEQAIPVLERILDEGHGFSETNLRANRETPGLLSDLAWCLWRSKGDSGGGEAFRDEAEALIGKALELNAKHLPTLVYRARMALEMEDRKNSIVFLKRILLIEPDHDWAQAYLAEQEDEPKSKGIFGLFKGRGR